VDEATPDSVQTTKGNIVNFTCDDGYQFSNGTNRLSTTCDGVDWSPIPAACASEYLLLICTLHHYN